METSTTANEHQAHVQALKHACTQLPVNFAEQAQNPDSCRELLTPVLAAVRDLEDEVLGKRFAQKRETGGYYWLEEDIFGSGFGAAEGSTHSMLEFLIVLGCHNQQQPFATKQCDGFGRFAFIKRRNLRLRQILFNNPKLSQHTHALSANKWNEWLQDFAQHYEAPRDSQNQLSGKQDLLPEHFAALRSICRDDFGRFVSLVQVLRAWAIDADKDRQWSTMFLFPFGYEALFWEIDTPDLKFQQNLMCGAGQNVFCMLARALAHQTQSATAATLKDRSATTSPVYDLGLTLVQRFFADHNGLNLLAAYLGGSMLQEERFSHLLEVRERATFEQLQADLSLAERVNVVRQAQLNLIATRFLPYRHLPRYDILLEDFTAISRLDLTKQELFLALGAIGHLHLICYLLEQEQAILKMQPTLETVPTVPTEATVADINLIVLVDSAQKTTLRSLSMRRLKENQALFHKARTHYIRIHWQQVYKACFPKLKPQANLKPMAQVVACNVLRAAFDVTKNMGFNLDQGKLTKPTAKQVGIITPTNKPLTINDLGEILVNDKRDAHMANLHQSWGRDIGLVTREGAVSYYYSLSDELLYYMVLALVPPERPQPLSHFLSELKRRYHLVIGPHEAQDQHYAIEEAEFVANAEQFKRKLQRNNLLINLSDSCDYVRNPFTSSSSAR